MFKVDTYVLHRLTIVNEERRREETDLKGIGTYHWVVLKKISRSFSFPTTFSCMKDNDNPSLTIVNNESSLMIVNDYPSLTIVNDDYLLTIVNDDPSLTIVNDDPSLTIIL